ncbi:MAG: STAS domain-containing protein [Bacteroidales bacterium]|nr:STAS domain-containing protein [Bacteroidales bacterium]
METTITREPGRVIVAIEGRVDTASSAELNEVLAPLAQETGVELVLDCEEMDYISSSGLRVLLGTQKEVTAHAGSLVVKNVQEAVKSVFNITGFSSFLDIR